MQIGVVGLGRMGGNIVRRLVAHGHDCVVFDRDASATRSLARDAKATEASGLADLVARLKPPRAIWLMLPAGEATDGAVSALSEALARGDVVIDGGNSFWHDDIRRAKALMARGQHYVDVGTSGGIWGLERGFCLMIGGEKPVIDRLEPIFAALAPGRGEIQRTPHREGDDARAERGFIHAGANGAGHFVKMIHNGIEYGLMQAYAEGFDILKHAGDASLPPERRLELNLADIAEVWRRGSVISSWLLDLIAAALAENPALADYSGVVADSGEGRWTLAAAIEEAVPVTVLSAALYARFRSRDRENFADKLLSAMRKGFGGHVESKAG
ncbi:MAG TPA: decarboxylating 6-phosphogluconate dehydrogenase [Stellaceae bacterium]|nr:decarboxylating 6-phosphogluconate dehydrogenase [Stellaceae bacterium]